MKGTVYPRPARKGIDPKTGQPRLYPVRKGEEYMDSRGRERTATADSTWTYHFEIGSKKAGNRKQHTRGGYRTRKGAEAALAEALADVGKGDRRVFVQPSAEKLSDYLASWVAGLEHQLKPSTLVGYRSIINAWIVPHIGDVSLRDITHEMLVTLYSTLRQRGGRKTRKHPNGRPLGARSIMSVHVLLAMALGDAVEAGKLPVKPTDQIPKRQRPRYRSRRQAGKYWDGPQAAKFMAAVRDERLFPLWSILLDSGMRRGEVCALRWPDVDLETGMVTVKANRVHTGPGCVVEGTTKSDRVRTFELDPRTVRALKTWHGKLAGDKLAAGESWSGDLDAGYVFVDKTGQPLRPDSLNYAFEKACKKAGVPQLSPHGLRHTAATLALKRGVPAHVVQERLGHDDVAITLGLYGHVVPGQQAEAARAIGDTIYGTG